MRRHELFGPDYGEIFCPGLENEILGTGSFSVTFKVDHEGTEAVLKVGKGCSAAHLDNEISILHTADAKLEELAALHASRLEKATNLAENSGCPTKNKERWMSWLANESRTSQSKHKRRDLQPTQQRRARRGETTTGSAPVS